MIKLHFDNNNNNNLNICNACVLYYWVPGANEGDRMRIWTSVKTQRDSGVTAHRETIWNMAGPTPENLEETIVLRLNEESEHSTSVQKRFFSRGDVCVRFHKKRPVEAPIVSLPKCNVCEMALIGVRGWWACTRIRAEFPTRSPSFPLFLSLSREDVCSPRRFLCDS